MARHAPTSSDTEVTTDCSWKDGVAAPVALADGAALLGPTPPAVVVAAPVAVTFPLVAAVVVAAAVLFELRDEMSIVDHV